MPEAAPQGQAPAAPISTDMRGVPDAVSRVQAILNAEPGDTPHKRVQAETPAAPKEQPAAQPEATPEAEAPAGPNKQVEGEEAPPEDAPAVAEIPLDQLEAIELEVSVQGEKLKLPIREIREGYMKEADYRKKTSELARQREQLKEETRKGLEAERVKYVTELQQLHDFVAQTADAELSNVNWKDLAQNNAFEYVRLDNRRKEVNQTLEAIKGKQHEVLAKATAEQKAAREEMAAKARTQLEADIPGWNDALYQSLMKAGIERYGYKQDEVAAWIDPRAFKILHKANLYDQMQAEKKSPAPEKKIVVAPKVVKPGAPQVTTQAQLREANAMKALRGNGTIAAAAEVLKSRMR